jgi:type II secretion system protein G
MNKKRYIDVLGLDESLLGDSSAAFTLVELLIVVAIIGILAAIAIPNFLQAQTRAKVSRTKADMRTIEGALALYHLDNKRFPPEDAPYQTYRVPNNVTTPVDYITSIPLDGFRPPGSDDPLIPENVWRRHVYQNYRQRSIYGCGCGAASDAPQTVYGAWVLNSIGPDRILSGLTEYDPTNGILSSGDIIRSKRRPENQAAINE